MFDVEPTLSEMGIFASYHPDSVDLHKPHDARQLSGVSNPASEA